jgi:hypothetical protein
MWFVAVRFSGHGVVTLTLALYTVGFGAGCKDDEPARLVVAGSPSSIVDSGAQGAVMDQCVRAEGLDGPDAPRSSCKSRRALLRCEVNADSTEVCLSDDMTRCPSSLAVTPICASQCEAAEYAASCGGVGPDIASAVAPEGCRSQGRTPAGPELFCCPCAR